MLFSRSEGAEFKLRRGKKKSIAANPLFIPAMMVWGAALGGLAVLVLPESMIRSVTEVSALGVLGGFARTFFAVLAALIGAGILYFVAKAFRSGQAGGASTLVNKAQERVRPIDPAAELGSESLDAPLELDEFVDDDTLELRPEDCVPHADDIEDAEEPSVDDIGWVEELSQDVPEERELTLGEWCEPYSDEEPVEPPKSRAARAFSRVKQAEEEPVELVKVFKGERARHAAEAKPIATEICEASEDPPGESSAQSATNPARPMSTAPIGTAADKLRNTPTEELSLVQMVERLALALNDHRAARESANAVRNTTKRDAALAEALRALTRFTEQGLEPEQARNENDPADDSQREMQAALSKLQSLRGAA